MRITPALTRCSTTSGKKMPRKSGNRRVELLLSPEQYEALLKEAEAGGYITILPELDMETSGSVAEFLRDHLAWTIASFGKAKPLLARGKYARKREKRRVGYYCPNCDSLNTRFAGDERAPGDDPEGSDDILLWMWFECADCGHRFRDRDADSEIDAR